MKIPWGILFLVAGIVLLNNTALFAGASTIGIVLLIFGILFTALWLVLIFILVLAIAFGNPNYVSKPSKKRRSKIPPRW